MAFKFDKTLRKEFDLDKALNGAKLVTADGAPAEILMVAEGVHHCSSVIFKWAQLDVHGKVINWHVTTATTDGQAQMGAGHRLCIYDGEISIEPTDLEIW